MAATQLRQADPPCSACHVPDLRLEFAEGFGRDAPLAPVIRDAEPLIQDTNCWVVCLAIVRETASSTRLKKGARAEVHSDFHSCSATYNGRHTFRTLTRDAASPMAKSRRRVCSDTRAASPATSANEQAANLRALRFDRES